MREFEPKYLTGLEFIKELVRRITL